MVAIENVKYRFYLGCIRIYKSNRINEDAPGKEKQ